MNSQTWSMTRKDRSGSVVMRSFIDSLSWDACLDLLATWAQEGSSRVTCICNVHSVVTANQDPALKAAIDNADMATPDGMPLVWLLRRSAFSDQQRINGPDLMWRFLSVAQEKGISIFFYGSTPETLILLQDRLENAFPGLQIAGIYSPPFRPLSDSEQKEEVKLINSSGAQVVFVGLGCPKQEVWMHRNKGRINAVMIGVGAAFDFHAGTVKRAPHWMQNNGLEWLYRLCQEPRRLFTRYAVTNSIFLLYVLKREMLGRLNRKRGGRLPFAGNVQQGQGLQKGGRAS